MSDIKRPTFLSAVFDHGSAMLYAVALHKFQKRVKDIEPGTEERFNEAVNITKNLGFIDRCWCRLAGWLSDISFWFMKDVDEEEFLIDKLLDDTKD